MMQATSSSSKEIRVKTKSYFRLHNMIHNAACKIIKLIPLIALGPIAYWIVATSVSTSTIQWPAQLTGPTTLAQRLYLPERPWSDGAPRWCAELTQNPRERRREPGIFDCKRDRFGALCHDGKPRFFSQYNQDIFTWFNHWRHLRRRGVYVDVAANEPVRISNTYFFDRCLGWRGLCVEANGEYRGVLRAARSCGLMPTCVSNRQENVTFLLQGGYSGVSATNKNNITASNKAEQRLTCVTTASAIDAAGMHRIDMLSLDVEGHELEVLQGIDWETTHINVVVMEDEAASEKATAFLQALGYRYLNTPTSTAERAKEGALLRDRIFVRADVIWGEPV